MTREERALQIWQVLIGAAHSRQTLTYEDLGEIVGLLARGVGRYLYIISRYCTAHDLPPLTVLVVQKASGLPSPGLTVDDANAAQQQVYAHPWYRMTPLSASDLTAHLKAD